MKGYSKVCRVDGSVGGCVRSEGVSRGGCGICRL